MSKEFPILYRTRVELTWVTGPEDPFKVYSYGLDLLAQDEKVSSTQWNATFCGYAGHGNVRLLTDEPGVVTDRYDYEAFGAILTAQGATNNSFLYYGEQYSSSVGVYHVTCPATMGAEPFT